MVPHMGPELTAVPAARSGEAMSHNLLQKAMVSELFLVVALTMALTPLMAEIGQRLGKAFEKSDVKVGHTLSTSILTDTRSGSDCLNHLSEDHAESHQLDRADHMALLLITSMMALNLAIGSIR